MQINYGFLKVANFEYGTSFVLFIEYHSFIIHFNFAILRSSETIMTFFGFKTATPNFLTDIPSGKKLAEILTRITKYLGAGCTFV